MKSLWPIVLAIFLTQIHEAQAGLKKIAQNQISQISTQHNFQGHNVGGARHLPFGSETAVDPNKPKRDLIGVRKNFNDRQQLIETMRFE